MKWDREFESCWRLAEQGHTAGLNNARKLVGAADSARERGSLSEEDWVGVSFNVSSLIINFGYRKRQKDVVQEGIDRARLALRSDGADHRRMGLTYNVANGLSDLVNIERIAEHDTKSPAGKKPFVLRHKEPLREARVMQSGVGRLDESDISRGMALCNLANVLDDSGRWVEAYQAYQDALAADPTNGNAAGNIAELLRRRIKSGRGLTGHYAAVHDKYLALAKVLRARTIEIAGVETADKWEAYEPFGDHGHLEHPGDELNDYQRWIRKHRLALTLAVEGLGSDNPRWDAAVPEQVAVLLGEPDPPTIFTSANVLKAEFLTARRLAFEGERRLRESPDVQHPTDTGVYADTLDSAIYGEPSAMLVLAQRATLDLLDKIAVAANDHFKVGRAPGNVDFRNFWFDHGTNVLAKGLPRKGYLPAAVAIAELSYDLDADGLYPNARVLRNAGTHRLVHVTHGTATGITDEAHSSVEMEELIAATHESLHVARASYLYLLDMVADGELERGLGDLPTLALPDQH